MNVDRLWAQAYAKGYYQGRAVGDGINPYEFEQPERAAWWEGYEFGVTDYCLHDAEEFQEEA